MAEIIPRWEWRSFGRRFGEAETRLAALTPGGVQESDEIYLLSGAGGNVKVRDALMDIKVLRQVNADGLEQWTPVMKAGFPLPASEAAKVFEALRLQLRLAVSLSPRRAHWAWMVKTFRMSRTTGSSDGSVNWLLRSRRRPTNRVQSDECLSRKPTVNSAVRQSRFSLHPGQG